MERTTLEVMTAPSPGHSKSSKQVTCKGVQTHNEHCLHMGLLSHKTPHTICT